MNCEQVKQKEGKGNCSICEHPIHEDEGNILVDIYEEDGSVVEGVLAHTYCVSRCWANEDRCG